MGKQYSPTDMILRQLKEVPENLRNLGCECDGEIGFMCAVCSDICFINETVLVIETLTQRCEQLERSNKYLQRWLYCSKDKVLTESTKCAMALMERVDELEKLLGVAAND